MPVYRIGESLVFPHPSLAEPDGLLGVGGDLCVERLLLAYRNGIFPWYGDEMPILWFSPDPRFVLEPSRLHVPRSLAKRIRRGEFEVRMDTAFEQVIRGCRRASRPGQADTWITADMVDAYSHLHAQGYAHSVETWKDGELVGGLYGVALGALFAGESMFATHSDASKVAFVVAVQQLAKWGFELIDSQVHTDHIERFGAHHISRSHYLETIATMVDQPGHTGAWTLDPDLNPRRLGSKG